LAICPLSVRAGRRNQAPFIAAKTVDYGCGLRRADPETSVGVQALQLVGKAFLDGDDLVAHRFTSCSWPRSTSSGCTPGPRGRRPVDLVAGLAHTQRGVPVRADTLFALRCSSSQRGAGWSRTPRSLPASRGARSTASRQ
jgi:hypothetical protein